MWTLKKKNPQTKQNRSKVIDMEKKLMVARGMVGGAPGRKGEGD